MTVSVAGLWHLGCVTTVCLYKAGVRKVIGITESKDEAKELSSCILPLEEPGMSELMGEGLSERVISFTEDVDASVGKSDYVWVCYDTPVNESDEADEGFVISRVFEILHHMHKGQGLVISSQLSVGTYALLEEYIISNNLERPKMCYSPENLRLGNAIDAFLNPDRIVAGVRTDGEKYVFGRLFGLISTNIIWMNPESAEMTKHAINSFLATSVVFINEIAEICEAVGADCSEVSAGLLSERRIGPMAYLKPGNAYSGGTLARDIAYLINKAELYGVEAGQITGTKLSNDRHKEWAYHKLHQIYNDELNGITILLMGLTYKRGTNTLRRSLPLELAKRLMNDGGSLFAYDVDIGKDAEGIPDGIVITQIPVGVLPKCDCIVVAKDMEDVETKKLLDMLPKHPDICIVDENGFWKKSIASHRDSYYTVGRSGC